MTNFQYMQQCSEVELADLLTGMIVNVVQQITRQPIPQEHIFKEFETITAYLHMEAEILQDTILN